MVVTLTAIFAMALLAAVLVKRTRDRRELERYSITPEALHALLTSNQDVLLFDVRQPLDLLGHRVIIPGAKWLAPQEVLENPLLIAIAWCCGEPIEHIAGVEDGSGKAPE